MKPFRVPVWYFWASGLIVLLLLADPIILFFNPRWLGLVDVPIGIFLFAGAVIAWVAGFYGHLYIRSLSPIVITESSIRQSSNVLHPLGEPDLGGEPFPPMSLYLVGGGADLGVAISDKDVLLVRKSAVERFGRKVLIVHAPVQPMPGAMLSGIAGYESAIAERAPHSGFAPKGKSMLLFSMLDSLHGLDSVRLREEQDFIVTKYARLLSEQKKWSLAGSKRFVQELRGLADAIRRQTPRQKISRFFSPPGSADQQAQQEQDSERVQ